MNDPSHVHLDAVSPDTAAGRHGGDLIRLSNPRSAYRRPSTALGLALTIACLGLACSVRRSPEATRQGMLFIPAGDFTMGSNQNPPGDESPQHRVALDGYWIDRLEVTNADYRPCVDSGGCSEPSDLQAFADPAFAAHPVVYVTWFQAQAYCVWRGKRLPTEAEWEKAARGTDGQPFPWGDDSRPDLLNAGGSTNGTRPIGSYPEGASPYGALDMAGNVWEWVDDWYAAYPGSAYRNDYFGEKYKVVRGGSWNHPIQDARTFHRDIASPGRALAVVGFRCAASP
jgi:formylglycine-generating enzyme required for sulfatase activity